MIKKWILGRKFVFDYVQAQIKGAEAGFATRLFKNAQADVLETFQDDLEKKAEELAKKKLNDLLSVVDMNAVVTINKQQGILYIGGERAEDGRLANLKQEADFLATSDIWKLIQESPKELAQKAMFVAGESVEDMKKGRAMLYTLSSQKNIVEILRGYAQKKPPIHDVPKVV
jgi:ATP-dependent protease HslVU (ClpYQ) peptidase subunit